MLVDRIAADAVRPALGRDQVRAVDAERDLSRVRIVGAQCRVDPSSGVSFPFARLKPVIQGVPLLST